MLITMKIFHKKKTFFYFAFVLMLLRYCFAYRNKKRRDIIIILKIVKFNFFILTDTVLAAYRRRDLGWNPSTLTVFNFNFFFH
jgi:hypothetical protein